MALKKITPPAIEPVSLAEAKSHLRVDGTDEDDLITGWITTAREYAEGYQNRTYITQTWELWLDCWPRGDYIRIPRPPLQVVASVKYYGTDGTEYTMDPGDYIVDAVSEPGRVALGYGKTWPATTLRPVNGIVARYTAGYGDGAEDVPKMVKQAILLMVGHWYRNREAAGKVEGEIAFAVHALLGMDRVVPV